MGAMTLATSQSCCKDQRNQDEQSIWKRAWRAVSTGCVVTVVTSPSWPLTPYSSSIPYSSPSPTPGLCLLSLQISSRSFSNCNSAVKLLDHTGWNQIPSPFYASIVGIFCLILQSVHERLSLPDLLL